MHQQQSTCVPVVSIAAAKTGQQHVSGQDNYDYPH
jgi:hypothetical protein